jgi:hypothetical protein
VIAEESLSVQLARRVLEITRSGYYAHGEPTALDTVDPPRTGSPI